MKSKTKFYFSVEGNTEKIYLEWLEQEINKNIEEKIEFDIKITNSPLKRLKTIPKDEKPDIFHFCDMESSDPYHQKLFSKIIDELDKSKSKNKVNNYFLCYSNFTFELWLILHKFNLYSSISNRKNYVKYINHYFKTDYRGLQEFKKKENVLRILKQLNLEDVYSAIRREKEIKKHNQLNNYNEINYKGYNYFRENPSSSVGENLERIFKEIGLLNE